MQDQVPLSETQEFRNLVPLSVSWHSQTLGCLPTWWVRNGVLSSLLSISLILGYIYVSFFLELVVNAAAKSLQLCPTLCDPIDGSPPGSPVPGILQARTLEWVSISFSNAWKWKVKVKSFSRVQPSATPWTAAHQAPQSMGFSRQEYPLPNFLLFVTCFLHGL